MVTNTRTVTAEAESACAFSIAEEYVTSYLADPSGAVVYLPLPFAFGALRRRVHLTQKLHIDTVERGRSHDEIRFAWRAGTRLLPDLHGTIRFRMASGRTRVIVEGTYAVPFGALGAVVDSVLGGRVARASLDDFVARIARELEKREQVWRTNISLAVAAP
jgi:hypothetical protein